MESQPMQDRTPTNPRRKKKSKADVFKEVYLPFVIVIACVLVVTGIIVAIAAGRSSDDSTMNQNGQTQLEQEAESLLSKAKKLARLYDYEGAIALLEDFSGNLKDFPEIAEAIDSYTDTLDHLVVWKAKDVPNLSVHTLIADLERALADPTYGQKGNGKYNANFITVDEFSAILQQLYDGGYVLVDLDDLYRYNETANTYEEKELRLPAGKKPFVLTQTFCNYYTYMIDGDKDGLADKGGAGFASKLRYDGGFYNEMVDADGKTVTGNFDVVPILESFIKKHSGFTYKGARAVLAFSGSDGIFGYRVTSDTLSEDALQKEQQEATELMTVLRETGYTIACYTYGNINYGNVSTQAISADLSLWKEKIAPIVGQTDILVFAKEGDIGTPYTDNDRFDVLYRQGFRFFMSNASFTVSETNPQYVRYSRLMLTGTNLSKNGSWFEGILTAGGLLDPRRNASN